MDLHLPSKMWLCKCWVTSLSTFSRLVAMEAGWLSLEPHRGTQGQPPFTVSAERKEFTVSFYSPMVEFRLSRNVR